MTSNKLIRHNCPAGCGWHRDSGQGRDLYKDEPGWDERLITHPLHGTVTNAAAAARDIARHECGAHKAALARLRAATFERKAA